MKSKSFLMAMLLMVTTSMAFVSCSKEDVEEVLPAKYTVKYEASVGFETTLRVFEYDASGSKIFDRTISGVKTGSKYGPYTADENATKVKIYISSVGILSDTEAWVQRVYYLKNGETTDIVIAKDATIGRNEP